MSQVPLTIFYSSFTKFFLLSLLSIWNTEAPILHSLPEPTLPPFVPTHPTAQLVWSMFDERIRDRHWVVRNVLGGMAAGFGLRGPLRSFLSVSVIDVVGGFSGFGLPSYIRRHCHLSGMGREGCRRALDRTCHRIRSRIRGLVDEVFHPMTTTTTTTCLL